MNKNQITEGNYYYSMPHWGINRCSDVEVKKIKEKLVVIFHEGYYATDIKDIPEKAIFESR